AGYEVPGAVEEVDPRLPLLAMVRQGGLSPELQSLFRKHAHKAPGKEPLDCGPLAKELQRRYGLQIPLSEDLTLAQLQEICSSPRWWRRTPLLRPPKRRRDPPLRR
ncbi:unnamed protein product, partial [Effrenium voratum]